MGSGSNRDDDDWREMFYESVVLDDQVKAEALMQAAFLRQPDDPEVVEADLQASRPYLKKCIYNMSQTEASRKRPGELASLWARGALGAASYRRDRRASPSRRVRTRRGDPSDDD